MGRKTMDFTNMTIYRDLFPKQLDEFFSFQDGPAPGSFRLETGKQKDVLFVPEPMIQVVQNAPPRAHATCRDDNTRALYIVERFRTFLRVTKVNIRRVENTHAIAVCSFYFNFVVGTIAFINIRSPDGHRTIDVNGQVRNGLGLLELMEIIDQSLCSPYSEGGDNNYAILINRFTNDLC